jgi:hypothetical protein
MSLRIRPRFKRLHTYIHTCIHTSTALPRAARWQRYQAYMLIMSSASEVSNGLFLILP